ncbi:hypothetical protein QUF49_00595 [Fictibacillus sp. b24]|uniref:hypothetical protein n=1 Tax=Fictibacillus sp. b24 TaxID=3055863 RepID=UPI0025A0D6B5|nr:hypothetical protein [Fictibacillus sp. b24]MDM5314469.1 hypothetical protein [Fictibacillus sp. b24]
MIVVQGARLLRDRWAGETLISETSKCGSPPAPRKAKHLERRSTLSNRRLNTFKDNKVS